MEFMGKNDINKGKKSVVKKVIQNVDDKAPISMVKKAVSPPAAKKGITQEMISKKAYELYEKRGRKSGFETEDWMQAKKILEAGA
jgi:hypothetical protein